MQDQVNLSRQERRQFNKPWRSDNVPSAVFLAGGGPGAKSSNQHAAESFEAEPSSRARGSAEGQDNRRSGREDIGTTSREAMVKGLTPSASRSIPNSAPRNRESTEKQRLVDGTVLASSDQARSNPVGGEQASDFHASGGQAGTSGGVSRNEGALSADGEWAEQIREKDELISTLKRQLTALGEQPMEEVVSLEVSIHSQS